MTWRRLAAGAGRPAGRWLVLAWAGGFAWFLHAARVTAEPPAHADGIVALTGGAERVETALNLLAEGRARLLLVSGVGGGHRFRRPGPPRRRRPGAARAGHARPRRRLDPRQRRRDRRLGARQRHALADRGHRRLSHAARAGRAVAGAARGGAVPGAGAAAGDARSPARRRCACWPANTPNGWLAEAGLSALASRGEARRAAARGAARTEPKDWRMILLRSLAFNAWFYGVTVRAVRCGTPPFSRDAPRRAARRRSAGRGWCWAGCACSAASTGR